MTESRIVSLRVAGDSVPLAPDAVLEALFATISYRLEPGGWASRFPTILEHLHEGSLDAASADRAFSELEQIGKELAQLSPDRVVWSMQDLRRIDDAQRPVRHGAPNVLQYFVARDGRPIVDCLKEAVQKSRMTGEPLVLGSELRFKNLVGGVVLTLTGILWGTVGYFFFPDVILVPGHASRDVTQHGPLLWPLGWLIAACGAAGTTGALHPSLTVWARAHARLVFPVAIVVVSAIVYVSWR